MATQNAQMAHKVEVVAEVKTRIEAASASIVSEYRGLTVAEMADLRNALAAVGGDYKIFKNTLVRRAIDGGEYQPLSEYLSGPSALTFVQGDISAVAKALRDFARGNPHLVIKGGLADGSLLTSSDLAALADLPPREVLLAAPGRRPRRPDAADGRPPPGAAAQPGLRDLGADRAARGRRRDAAGPRRGLRGHARAGGSRARRARGSRARRASEAAAPAEEAPAAGEPVEAAAEADGDAGAAASAEEASE